MSRLFKVNGETIHLTEGQVDIFEAIVFRISNRLEILTCTQYGKSLTVALAALVLSCIVGRLVSIIAPTNDKAKLIMRYYIEHLGDDPLFYTQLEKNTKLERLKQEESKERIILRNGGGVYCISAQSSSMKKSVEAAMGEGSDDAIMDEAGLINDQSEATIFRMIAGKKDGFYCKIGNPFYRNHFYKSYLDPRYKKIEIDYHQALAEGRYSQEFIDEARDRPFFDVLYECKFPEEAEMINGYRKLLHNVYLDNAEIEVEPEIKETDSPILGVDIAAGGGNQSVYVLRYPKSNYAKVLEKNNDGDLMVQVQKIIKYKNDYNIKDYHIAIDDVGVGAGVSDALNEKDIMISPIKEGESADDKERFANRKAELNWEAAKWIKGGGKLLKDEGFREGEHIYYKENTSSKLQMEPKSDLQKRGIDSPDTWDAFCLTFINTNKIIEEDDFDII